MFELSLVNIEKKIKNRRILRQISLEIKQGEIVGLLGPNGAGKTTSFYTICGIVRPDRGKVILNGTNITPLPIYMRARMGIGYLPQERSLFQGLTVEENLLAVLEIISDDKEYIEERCFQLLSDFHLSHLKTSKASSLSGGESRRLEIARALVNNPKLLLLDEPFAGVDPVAIADIQKIIKKLKEDNIGVLLTDHNVRETLNIVDRAYIIYEGKVLLGGSPKEIIRDEKVRKIYLGESFS